MKVYILEGYDAYEPPMRLGIFSSEAKAKSHAQSLFYQGVHWSHGKFMDREWLFFNPQWNEQETIYYETVCITEVEVQ